MRRVVGRFFLDATDTYLMQDEGDSQIRTELLGGIRNVVSLEGTWMQTFDHGIALKRFQPETF
jgi:hypothetical protein